MSYRSRVLVCDDDSQTLRALRAALSGAGFGFDPTTTGEEALDRAALSPPDAAIIELVLPDGDGADVCRCLREWSGLALIVLSAVTDEHEKVRALEAGADDYVTKPFAPRELVARLQATLRRTKRVDVQPRLQLDGVEVDLAARVVRRDSVEVHLTPIEFKLLAILLTNRERVLTHNYLLREIWGSDYPGYRQVLRAHMANLRRKIETADGPPLIRTYPGVGYRLADQATERSTHAMAARSQTSLASVDAHNAPGPLRQARVDSFSRRRVPSTGSRRAA